MFKSLKTFIVFSVVLSICLLSFSSCRTKTVVDPERSYEGIELTYYKMFDDSDIIEPIIAQYVADKPGLKINYKKFVDFEDYLNLIINEMAEGEGPDIFSMQNTWFASNFKKLSPMPAEFGSINDYDSLFVDVASKDLIRTDQTGVERVYAVPMTVDTLALYYNKDHFDDRLPAQGRPSSTWEGIKEDVSKLTKEDNSFSRFEVSGIALGRGENISRSVDILYLLFLQNGLKFYNDNMSEAIFAERQAGASERAAVDALEFYVSFSEANQKYYSWNDLVVETDSIEKEVEAFARGEVSMIVGFAYTYDDIVNQISVLKTRGVKTIAEDVIKSAPIPQLYDPETSKEKRVSYASYFAETVSRNSEHADIAWDFLIYLSSKDNLQYYFDEEHKPTSRRDMIEEQKKHPIYGVFASQIGYAESFPILNYHDYKNLFSSTIDSVSDGADALQELVKAQDALNDLLPEGGYIVPTVDLTE